MSITEQALAPVPRIADAPGAPGEHIRGYTGQGWSTHETMLVVRWLFANPGAWEQAMAEARDPLANPHTVADTLHEKLVPRAELDKIAALGFDPTRVNWLEIAHELIERRHDPRPAQEHAGTGDGIALSSPDGPAVTAEAMHDPGLPVPADKTDVAMFTAHRLDDMLSELAHATERMKAARATTVPQLRAYRAGHIHRHLQHVLASAHELVANIREHYPAEAAELEEVRRHVGLAKAVSDDAKSATTAHLLETTLHESTHGARHAREMLNPEPADVWEFNADHAEKHLGGAVEHTSKLAGHFRDNYPEVGKWLHGLGKVTGPPEEGDGSGEHARYAGRDGHKADSISGQAAESPPS